MASFEQLLDLLTIEYPDPSERGVRFEPILRDALLTSPSHQFSDVWLWADWRGNDGGDRGIDLVAVAGEVLEVALDANAKHSALRQDTARRNAQPRPDGRHGRRRAVGIENDGCRE